MRGLGVAGLLLRLALCLLAVALPALPARAQSAGRVTLVSPEPEAVLGWGRDAPVLVIRARLEGVEVPAGARVYMTANIFEADRIVDGVRLYDDATHGDERAADGTFTSEYRPQHAHSYAVEVRCQTSGAGLGAGPREAVSPRAAFHVEPIPHPRIMSPEPGGNVGRTATVRARLLLGDQPFTADEPGLKTEAWTAAGEGSGGAPVRFPADRRGSLVTSGVEFRGLGRRPVGVTVSLERRGRRLEASDGPVYVRVADPPVLFFYVAGAMLLLYFLLPPRKAIPLFQHSVQLRDRTTRRTLKTFNLDSASEGEVRRSVGGEGADVAVSGAGGVLCTLVARPGQARLDAQAGEKGELRSGDGTQQSLTVEPNRARPAFQAGSVEFVYLDAIASGARRFPRWQPTPLKLAALLLMAGALALAFWQRAQFFQQ